MDEVEEAGNYFTDFDVICRFCMKFSLFLKPIFYKDDNDEADDFDSTDGNSETVVQMINLCTQLMISLDDKLPKFMCNSCMDELLRSNKFRKQCLKSDEMLRKIMKSNAMKKAEEKDDDIKSLDEIYDVDKIYDLKDNELNEINARSNKLFRFNPTLPDLMTSRNHDSDESSDHNEDVNYGQEGCNDENSSFKKYLRRKTSNDKIKSGKDLYRLKCPECKIICSNQRIMKNHFIAHEKFGRKILDNGSKDDTETNGCISNHFQPLNGKGSWQICGNLHRITFDVKKQHRLPLGIKAYRCDQCTKYFKSHRILVKHRKVHVREKEVLECWKCNTMFLLPTSYRRHMKAHNLMDKYNIQIS